MVKPRNHLQNVYRDRQHYETRLDNIRLDFNEYVPHIPYVLFEKILKEITPELFSAYPEVNSVYETLSKYYHKSTDNFVLAHGSDGAISMTLAAFCEPGDTIGITSPTYGMYPVYAKLLNCNLIEECYNTDWEISAQQLSNLLTPSTKVIAIANPNGITGRSFSTDIIYELIQKASSNGTVVLLDEAYVEFSKNNFIDNIDEFDNLVLARSFSKSLGLAGLRAGYVVANKSLANIIYKMKPVVEINSVAAIAIKNLLKPEYVSNTIKSIIDSKIYFSNELRKLGFKVADSETNFVMVDFGKDRQRLMELFDSNKISVKTFKDTAYFDPYVRITVGTQEVMEKVVNFIKQAV